MKIKEVKLGIISDSRGKDTVFIDINGFSTSAPSGKSTGTHEVPCYRDTIMDDFKSIKELTSFSNFDFKKFEDLTIVEKLFRKKIGGNTLFALEASILKAIASERKKELWQFLGGRKIPKLLSNTIGGGRHTKGKKPDFQEFLVVGDKKHNVLAHKEAKKILKTKKLNDENACVSDLSNEEVLNLMSYSDGFGIDIAASEFYADRKYWYKNKKAIRTRQEQIDFVIDLIENYKPIYVEDPLQEEDFKGFAEILKKTKGKCLIVGDDLTTTNFKRVKKAIEMKAINGLIVKPNQIGSLLEVKKVIDLCKKNNVKIIVSHRSGETMDDTIADLAVGWGADYIKIPVVGKERLAKVDRIENIKRKIR